jgi:hypothetical protein
VSAPASRRLAWAVFAGATALLIADLVLEWATRNVHGSEGFGLSGAAFAGTILISLTFFSFAATGVLIAARVPRNPIGWMLLAIAYGWALVIGSIGYGDYALKVHPGALPAGPAVASVSGWVWAPPVALTAVFLLLVYPDGRLPGPRWRPVVWICGAALAIGIVVDMLMPGPMTDLGFPHHRNPFGVAALAPVLRVLEASVIAIPLGTVAAVASLVVRFRRAGPVERLQIKWLAAAGTFSGSLYALVLLSSALFAASGRSEPGWDAAILDVWFLTLSLIPAAIGVAVLRYRLFEIDVIIRRTLVYALLVGSLALVYLGGVSVAGALLRGLTGSSGTLAVTASTLAVALAFQPFRGVIQRTVDRRFYRSGYDARAAVDGFSERMREQIDLDALRRELLAVVAGIVQPTHASVWLRPDASDGPPG